MPDYDEIAIVGVGLLGGSIALAAKNRGLANAVVGIGRDEARLEQAVAAGLIDRATTNLATGVQAADLVVVCTPVDSVVGTVAEVLLHCRPQCMVTDVGSTKKGIASGVSKSAGQFVGSHPLAGDHRKGADHSRSDMLDGRVVVMTPTESTAPETTEKVTNFWRAIGARVVLLTPEEHDTALAITSHLPHMVAAALARTTPEDVLTLAATGWADTTRVAAADPELWRQIFLANDDSVLAAIDLFTQQLTALRTALADRDGATLEKLLAEGKQTRDALAN